MEYSADVWLKPAGTLQFLGLFRWSSETDRAELSALLKNTRLLKGCNRREAENMQDPDVWTTVCQTDVCLRQIFEVTSREFLLIKCAAKRNGHAGLKKYLSMSNTLDVSWQFLSLQKKKKTRQKYSSIGLYQRYLFLHSG